jgi:putative ABC transport system substrate-binding protein
MAYLSDDDGLTVDRLDPAGISRELIPNTFGEAARKLGITLTRWVVNTPLQLERAFATLKPQEVNGLYVDTGRHLARIADLAREHRLPACYGHGPDAVPVGGLMGYVSLVGDPAGIATFVDKILRGAKPGDLPMEEPKVYELWLNLKAAKAIGLTIPASLQAQVTRVFE